MQESMRIFLDPELDAKYARDGFVIVRMMEDDEARAIDEECRRRLPAQIPAHENVTFIYDGEPELEWIERIVGPVIDRAMLPLLDDMVRLHSSLIIKPAGEKPVPPHVHPIFTLEQNASDVFCWCALQDMDDSNGVMQVLPGSHKLFPIMPMFGQEPYFLKTFNQIAEKMEPVYLRAGEAMLFDETLIHASKMNTTARNRIALASHCIKRAMEPITLFRAGRGQYKVCATGREFGYQYHSRTDEIEPPAHWPVLGYVDDVHRLVEPDEFWERLASGEHVSLTFPLVDRREREPEPASAQPQPQPQPPSVPRRLLGRIARRLSALGERALRG